MHNNKLKVGDTITIPFPTGEKYEGIIMDIDDYVDPRMKYKIGFDDPNLIMFYSENMIKRILAKK